MYHIPLKNWMNHVHVPKRHDMAVGMGHVFHDERFWAIVGAAILFAILIGLAIIANRTGMEAPDFSPTRTFFPISV